MPILNSTIRLGTSIDDARCQVPSLKGLAALGAVVAAKSAPLQSSKAMLAKTKAADKSWLGNLFSGLWSKGKAGIQAVTKVSGKVMTAAKKAGVAVPLDKNMAALSLKAKTLRQLIARNNSYESQYLKKLLGFKDAGADALSSAMGKAISQARTQANAAIVVLDKAVAEAQASQKAMLAGTPSVQALAVFGVKELQAGTAFNQARLRLEKIQEFKDKADKTLYDKKGLVEGSVAKAKAVANVFGQSFAEAGSKAASAAVEAGLITEEAVKKGGKGLKTAAGFANYLPVVLIGGAVLYIVMAGRGAGAGMGEMFKSVGKKVEG